MKDTIVTIDYRWNTRLTFKSLRCKIINEDIQTMGQKILLDYIDRKNDDEEDDDEEEDDNEEEDEDESDDVSKVGKARGSVKHSISSIKNLSKSLNDISLTDKTLILISRY